ncbi:MAG: DNA polymerase I [Deltaproteobacteria bacterium]|nr:MAG: DNA polymerase I [Deltaproteobacteria bacterium]
MPNKKVVYLIDGTSYIHRAYHAVGSLSNSKGFPTNAIYVFTRMLIKLLSEEKPEYMAVALDAKGPTFRHKIYADYKANRPPTPEDLSIQIPKIKQIVKKLGIKLIEIEGYEADDIIATLSKKCQENGFKVVLVTGDKDFKQLVTPNAIIWDTMKDEKIDYNRLKEELGFDPSKYVDVLALAGDKIDNIPGVPGIGEKTALKLIRKFGSLEGIYKNINKITHSKVRENLIKYKDSVFLSRELARMNSNVPLNWNINMLKIKEPDREGLVQIFKELEFRELLSQFISRKDEENDYRVCADLDLLKDIVKQVKKKGFVSVDTETTSEDPFNAKLVGISMSWEQKKGYYLPIGHTYLGVENQLSLEESRQLLKEILEDEKIKKIGHNIKYDAEVLKLHGIELKGIHFDTMIASYVISPGLRQHNLDYLCEYYLGHKMIGYKDVVGKGIKDFSQVSIETAVKYSCEDADYTLRLKDILEKKLKEDKNEELFYNIEMKLVPVLIDMEMAGVKVDIKLLWKLAVEFREKLKQIEEEIYKEAGMRFNINSSQQLGFVLFEKLKLPILKKTQKTKRYSTDVSVLKKLCAYNSKVPSLVLQYRTISKLKSTYIDALIRMADPKTHRIHTSYNQTVTATGRLSSSDPNLQNIPARDPEGRQIRKAFIAEDGYLLMSADYSQIELRVLAHYSNDEELINAFKNNEDIHTKTAIEVLGIKGREITPEERRLAKAINFGIIYGMGPKRLSEEIDIDYRKAKEYIDRYYEKYKGVARFREEIIEFARKNGYVTTLFNRRRYIPDINSENHRIRAEAERIAINTPIQGTAADLIKKAMINIHERMKKESPLTKMIMQVHDELVFEVPEKEVEKVKNMVKEEMEGVYPMRVPLKVDISIGKNWDEAH